VEDVFAGMVREWRISGAEASRYAKWKLVRTNREARCRGCGDTIRAQAFRLRRQPDESTIHLNGLVQECSVQCHIVGFVITTSVTSHLALLSTLIATSLPYGNSHLAISVREPSGNFRTGLWAKWAK